MNSPIPNFGELKTLNPRVAWPNEARDFTPWLASHITNLGQLLDMQLELTATETRIGDFCLDILAKDLNSDRQVIIENQFGPTDHDHLGKLLAQKDEIEREFGEPLEWERQDDKPASRVAIYRDGAIEDSDQRLAEIRAWCVDHLLKLKRVFGRRLTEISV